MAILGLPVFGVHFTAYIYPSEKAANRPNSASSIGKTWESRLLSKVHKTATPVSDIDRYFDSPVVDWDFSDDPN
jgi:hypothetical protein